MTVVIGRDKLTDSRPFYGAFRELGSNIVRNKVVVGHVEGTHFMERAFETTAQTAASTAVSLIAEGVEREANALRRRQ